MRSIEFNWHLQVPSSSTLASESPSSSMAGEMPNSQSRVKIAMKIPQQLGGLRAVAGEEKEGAPAITLVLQVSSKKRNMGKEQASFHLAAHHSAQFRRLWHQVECEALSLQALGFAEAECHKKAMANVHARAMEGYLVWLQNRREPQRDRQGREKLSFLLGQVRSGALGSFCMVQVQRKIRNLLNLL
ncbi:unnamed protein product [Cladocopium goreaui]|uniref:Uncharacterized protein n=1 Tax=Cladocopium goreaui TaxID=2562237 RepID=A0A9P1G6P5_9DINO|nr:unnamed protein product [Cladocopium goreaui]